MTVDAAIDAQAMAVAKGISRVVDRQERFGQVMKPSPFDSVRA
jgi:hypothetical protein